MTAPLTRDPHRWINKFGVAAAVAAALCVGLLVGAFATDRSALRGRPALATAPVTGDEDATERWFSSAATTVTTSFSYAKFALEGSRNAPLTPAERETLLAMTAVRYVSTRLSPLRYGYVVDMQGQKIATMDDVIANEAGICGNQVEATLRLLRKLGLRARSVQYYRAGPKGNESHIIVEVLSGGAWRFMDVTWRAWFLRDPKNPLDLVSAGDLAAYGRHAYTMRLDSTSMTGLVAASVTGDVMSYLDGWRHKVVLHGVSGSVRLLRDRRKRIASWTPAGVPNFVGRTLEVGELAQGAVETVLERGDAKRLRSIQLRQPVVACAEGSIVARTAIDGELARRPLRELQSDGHLPLTRSPSVGQDIILSVSGPPDEACYLVYSRISALM